MHREEEGSGGGGPTIHVLARVCALFGGVLRLLVCVRRGLWVLEEQRGGPWWAWVACDDG